MRATLVTVLLTVFTLSGTGASADDSIREKVRATYNVDPAERPEITKEDVKKTATFAKQYASCVKRKFRDLKREATGDDSEAITGECGRCMDDPDLPACNPRFTEAENAGSASGSGGRSDTLSPMSGVEVVPKK